MYVSKHIYIHLPKQFAMTSNEKALKLVQFKSKTWLAVILEMSVPTLRRKIKDDDWTRLESNEIDRLYNSLEGLAANS